MAKSLNLPLDTEKKVSAYRFTKNLKSDAAAILALIDKGIEAEKANDKNFANLLLTHK